MKRKILIVEDEPNMSRGLKDNLEFEGYDVDAADNGATGLSMILANSYALVVMDVMMPEMSGLDVLKKMRDAGTAVPVIMLTAKSEEIDKILGLELGADDYITKPFDSEVLLLKIKAILKRNEETNREQENREFDLGNYHFNPKLRELSHGGKMQTLSPKENELLKLLAEHMNDLLPREQALKKIWGSDTYFNGRSMDVYIAKLRKYLKEDPNIEIVNIHGNGFRLVVPTPAA